MLGKLRKVRGNYPAEYLLVLQLHYIVSGSSSTSPFPTMRSVEPCGVDERESARIDMLHVQLPPSSCRSYFRRRREGSSLAPQRAKQTPHPVPAVRDGPCLTFWWSVYPPSPLTCRAKLLSSSRSQWNRPKMGDFGGIELLG